MDECARMITAVCARIAKRQDQLSGSDCEGIRGSDDVIFFTLMVQYRIDVSDFEEHLRHGVGKKATDAKIQTMAVYCEKGRTSSGTEEGK